MEFNYFKDWLFDLMNESDDHISNISTLQLFAFFV